MSASTTVAERIHSLYVTRRSACKSMMTHALNFADGHGTERLEDEHYNENRRVVERATLHIKQILEDSNFVNSDREALEALEAEVLFITAHELQWDTIASYLAAAPYGHRTHAKIRKRGTKEGDCVVDLLTATLKANDHSHATVLKTFDHGLLRAIILLNEQV